MGRNEIQDTPYSISVMPADLIENLQASTVDKLFRINPITQTNFMQNENNIVTTNIRGFNVLDYTEDGVRSNNAYGVSLEEVERVEVLSSLSSFLYGAGDVGGSVNYVLKRPTPTPFASLTVGNFGVGNEGGSQYYGHLDVGGPIDSQGKLGFRANLLLSDGNLPVAYQSLYRNLASLALDYHITDKMLLQLGAAHQDYKMHGQTASWSAATGAMHGSAPDVDQTYSQPWAYNHTESNKGSIKYTYTINDQFALRAAYKYQEDERSFVGNVSNTLQANGTYTQLLQAWAPNIWDNFGGYAFLDSRFNIASIQNKITVGYSGNQSTNGLHQNNASLGANLTLTGLTFSNPYRPEPIFPTYGTLPSYVATRNSYQSIIIGDEITFNKQWSALVGVNDADIFAKNTFSGSAVSDYNKSAWTPTASVIYKPLPFLTTVSFR